MSEIKVEIRHFRPVDKGALKATFTVMIHNHGKQKIAGCKYFVKGENRWFGHPDFKVKKQDKDDYIPYVSYEDKDYLAKLQEAILIALKDAKPQESSGQTYTQNRQAAPLQDDSSFVW